MSDLIAEFRNLKTSAEVAQFIPKAERQRNDRQQTIDVLEKSCEDAILSGPEARNKLRGEIAEAKDQLEETDAILRVAGRRLKEFRDNETNANLEAASKQANTDVGEAYKLGVDVINLCSQIVVKQQQYILTKQRIKNFLQVAAKAGRQDLKPPADPIAKAMSARGMPWTHPAEDPALLQAVKHSANQKLLLNKLGLEI